MKFICTHYSQIWQFNLWWSLGDKLLSGDWECTGSIVYITCSFSPVLIVVIHVPFGPTWGGLSGGRSLYLSLARLLDRWCEFCSVTAHRYHYELRQLWLTAPSAMVVCRIVYPGGGWYPFWWWDSRRGRALGGGHSWLPNGVRSVRYVVAVFDCTHVVPGLVVVKPGYLGSQRLYRVVRVVVGVGRWGRRWPSGLGIFRA